MRPYQNYQKVNVSTADPVRIVVLLYEGAIKNLNQAVRLMGSDNDTVSAKILRTQDILNYLRNALDHEKGGEIAVNLERLYNYMRDVLAEANLKLDGDKIKQVIGLLQTLLEGWRGIASNQTTNDIEGPPSPVNLSMVG